VHGVFTRIRLGGYSGGFLRWGTWIYALFNGGGAHQW
jgi:hypothetical protein